MTRKKSNVKALALAVTCAILAGGGIGLKPVYAADGLVSYDTSTHKLKQGGTTVIETLTIGGVTISGSGTTYGITIGDTSKHVMISDHDISATGSVSANIIASGINARMEGGKVVAQNGLYIGYDGTDITQATYDNSRFAVNGENGSFRAANGKFTVSSGGAITADSLALTGTDGTTRDRESNTTSTTPDKNDVVGGAVGSTVDEGIDAVTDTILDIAGIKTRQEQLLQGYNNITGFSYDVKDKDNDNEYTVIYKIDLTKINDTDLARFNIDRNIDTLKTTYENQGYTCK